MDRSKKEVFMEFSYKVWVYSCTKPARSLLRVVSPAVKPGVPANRAISRGLRCKIPAPASGGYFMAASNSSNLMTPKEVNQSEVAYGSSR